jgi:hypothetical protein
MIRPGGQEPYDGAMPDRHTSPRPSGP